MSRPTLPPSGRSAAEVVLLRHIHGIDSVTALEEVGEKKQMSFAAERDRLEVSYGDVMVGRVFGPRGIGSKLPREVEDISVEAEGDPVDAGDPGNRAGGHDVTLDA